MQAHWLWYLLLLLVTAGLITLIVLMSVSNKFRGPRGRRGRSATGATGLTGMSISGSDQLSVNGPLDFSPTGGDFIAFDNAVLINQGWVDTGSAVWFPPEAGTYLIEYSLPITVTAVSTGFVSVYADATLNGTLIDNSVAGVSNTIPIFPLSGIAVFEDTLSATFLQEMLPTDGLGIVINYDPLVAGVSLTSTAPQRPTLMAYRIS